MNEIASWDKEAAKLVYKLAFKAKKSPASIFDRVSIVVARGVARKLRSALGPVLAEKRRFGKTNVTHRGTAHEPVSLNIEPSKEKGHRGGGTDTSTPHVPGPTR